MDLITAHQLENPGYARVIETLHSLSPQLESMPSRSEKIDKEKKIVQNLGLLYLIPSSLIILHVCIGLTFVLNSLDR